MDFNSNKPIYRQIIDFSFNNILSGEWGEGERIPSVRELAGKLAVNSHTVLKAMEYLQQRDIIYQRRGMGFYLHDDARRKVNDDRRNNFFNETLPQLFKEMERLGISMEEIVGRFDSQPHNSTENK